MGNEIPQVLRRSTVLTWGSALPAAIFALLAFIVLRWHWTTGGYIGRQQAEELSPLIPAGAALVALLNSWTLLPSWTKVSRVFLAALLIPLAALILLNMYVVRKIWNHPAVVGIESHQALASLSVTVDGHGQRVQSHASRFAP